MKLFLGNYGIYMSVPVGVILCLRGIRDTDETLLHTRICRRNMWKGGLGTLGLVPRRGQPLSLGRLVKKLVNKLLQLAH